MAGKEAHNGPILMTVGEGEHLFGWKRDERVGSINKIPYFGKNFPDNYYYINDICYDKNWNYTQCDLIGNKPNISFNIQIDGISRSINLRTNNFYVIEDKKDSFNFENKVGKTIEVTFTPPHWLLGFRNPQTDLGRGYYVEVEDHWEAQDAEQGSVNDRESELQPSLRHPTVLRRTSQRDVLHLDFSRWNFKDRYCFRRARRNSQNAYLQTKHQGEYHYRKLQRGLHSYTTTGYHGSGSTYRSSLNIHSIQRCSGSLLVSYRRASYA